ncbi:hypothetical protein Hanom_Chr07g00665591 [Helianthus anomalus]
MIVGPIKALYMDEIHEGNRLFIQRKTCILLEMKRLVVYAILIYLIIPYSFDKT